MRTLPWHTHQDTPLFHIEKQDRPILVSKVVFLRGYEHDPKGKEGLAQFTTALLLRGTKNKSREEISTALETLGLNIDVNVGAHSCVFNITLLRKNLNPCKALLEEIFSSPAFDATEFLKLKQDLKARLELDLENDGGLAKAYFNQAIYANHYYGHDSDGYQDTLENITLEDVKHFFEKHFSSDTLMFATCGYITLAESQTWLSDFKAKLPRSPTVVLEKTHPKLIEENMLQLISKPQRTQSHFLIGGNGLPITHPDQDALSLFFETFAGATFQAQYMQEIRVKRGWSYGAYGTLDGRKNAGGWYLYTYTELKDTFPAIELSLELLEKAAFGEGITDDQIEFTKNHLIKAFPFDIDVPEKILREKVFNKIVGLPEDHLEKSVERLEQLTPAHVRLAAKKHLDLKKIHITLLTDTNKMQHTKLTGFKTRTHDYKDILKSKKTI